MLYNDQLINTIWGNQLVAIARVLASHRDFFELPSSLRQEKVSHLSLSIQPYLVSVDENRFLADADSLFTGSTQRTDLVQVLSDYFFKSFIPLVDDLPDNYGSCSLAEKVQLIENLKGVSIEAEILATFSLAQIELSVQDLMRRFSFSSECVLVESPLPMSLQMKKTIRSKYANDVVFFHVKSDLLGGARVLKSGQVFDYSWSKKINRISQKLNVL